MIFKLFGLFGTIFAAKEADEAFNGGEITKTIVDGATNPARTAAKAAEAAGKGLDYLTARDGGALDDIAAAGEDFSDASGKAIKNYRETGSFEKAVAAATPEAPAPKPEDTSTKSEFSTSAKKPEADEKSFLAQAAQYGFLPAAVGVAVWLITKNPALATAAMTAVFTGEVSNYGITDLFNYAATELAGKEVAQKLGSAIGINGPVAEPT